jgi:hypothetical protein
MMKRKHSEKGVRGAKRRSLRRIRMAGMATCVLLILSLISVEANPPPFRAIPSGATGLTPATPLVGPLHTSGTSILDANNQPVILKGIVRDGPEYSFNSTGPTNFPSSTELQAMHNWGANYLRLQLSADLVNQAFGGQACLLESYDPQYANELSQVVTTATGLGMLVDLDMVFTNPQCDLNEHSVGWSGGDTFGMPGQDVDQALGVLAQQFGSNPLVAFELYNEPHECINSKGNAVNGTGVCGWSEQAETNFWADGGTFDQANLYQYSAAGMNELYQTVRNVTSDLVFIDANWYASDNGSFSDGYLNAVSNAVYVFHYYPCEVNSGSTTNGVCYNGDPEFYTQIENDLSAHLTNNQAPWPAPVVINEFGWPQNVSETYNNVTLNLYGHGLEMQNVVTFLDSQGIGWAAFAWDGNASVLPWQLVAAIPGYTPNTDGVPIQNSMQGQDAQLTNPPSGYN